MAAFTLIFNLLNTPFSFEKPAKAHFVDKGYNPFAYEYPVENFTTAVSQEKRQQELRDKLDHEPVGKSKKNPVHQWGINPNGQMEVAANEWQAAKSILNRCLEAGIQPPFKITRGQWSKEFPELKHSFVCVEKAGKATLAAVALSKPTQDSQGQLKEGILGLGRKGIVKPIMFEEGETAVIKVKSPSSDNEAQALERLGRLHGHFTTHRDKASPWIPGRDGRAKTIKDFEYLITDRAEGQSLKDYLKHTTLDFEEKKQLAMQLLEYVDDMHNQGVVHGDLNVNNILISNQGQMSVIDFGAAQLVEPNQEVIGTQTKGSRQTMAPEVGIWSDDKGWVSQQRIYSAKSDLYSLGKIFEHSLKLKDTHPQMKALVEDLTELDRQQRPTAAQAMETLKSITAKKLKPISYGQGLLMLIADESDENLRQRYQQLYLSGLSKASAQEMQALEQACLHQGYQLEDDAQVQADDPTRRYFETHLSLETMKHKASQISLETLEAFYEQIKTNFEPLGGDLDRKLWEKHKRRESMRDYDAQIQERLAKGLNPRDFIKGLSDKEQQALDRCFRGEFTEKDGSMHQEYAELVNQVQRDSRLDDEQKQKILLVIKSTRLNMMLGKKISKYQKLGLYQGDELPLGDVYSTGLYLPENRGRIAKEDQQGFAHHHKGLLKPHNPLSVDDEAFQAEPYPYQKPSDRSDLSQGADWINLWQDEKVHTFSNSISGTMLVQLKQILKQHQDGTLPFKDVNELRDYLSLMMASMTYNSGGHSLYEFAYPTQLQEVQEAFKELPGFESLDLARFFGEDNEVALERALDKTLDYQKNIQTKQSLHDELLAKVSQVEPIEAQSPSDEALPYVPKLEAKKMLTWQADRALSKHAVDVQDYSFAPHAIQSDTMIKAMAHASNGSFLECAALTPQRMLMHEVAAYVTARVRVPTTERDACIRSVMKELGSTLTEETQVYTTMKEHALKSFESHRLHDTYIDAHTELALQQAQSFVKQYPQAGMDANELASELVATQAYQSDMSAKLKAQVEDYFAKHTYPLKHSSNLPQERFVAGGSGSGKSAKVAQYLEGLKQQGVAEEEVAVLNNDSFKPLLERDSMPERLMSQLTHDEARLIRDKAFELAHKHKHHVLLDQCSLSSRGTQKALKNGKSLTGAVVNLSAETALKRSLSRGYTSKRFESSQGLLETHQKLPGQALNYLKRFSGQSIDLTFEDTNETPKVFMSADLKCKRIDIHDLEGLREFVKKQFIDVKAKHYSELYPEDIDERTDQACETLINSLKNHGYDVRKSYGLSAKLA